MFAKKFSVLIISYPYYTRHRAHFWNSKYYSRAAVRSTIVGRIWQY